MAVSADLAVQDGDVQARVALLDAVGRTARAWLAVVRRLEGKPLGLGLVASEHQTHPTRFSGPVCRRCPRDFAALNSQP